MPVITNPNASNLDQQQILQRSFDEANDRLRTDAQVTVTAITAEVSVEIDAADGDNIAIANADGSKKVTVTTVSGKEALDVNITNPQITVSTPTLSNVSIALAATEQSFSIPSGTKRFSLKIRGNSNLNVSYISGQSGTNFLLVPTGSEYIEDNLYLASSLSIYFQSDKNTQILEIITWI